MGYEIKVALVLGITLFSIGVQCGPIGSSRRELLGEPVFDVTQFGARGDGLADGSLAFMKAWNAACAVAGPATLRVPLGRFKVGKVVFQGPCKSNPLNVQFQGTVAQTTDPSAMSGNEPAMLFNEVSNILFSGGGTIDGQGAALWKYNTDGTNLLPISVQFSKAKFCTIENLKFLNAKGVHFKVTSSDNMLVQNLNINAPGDSPNTDGVVVSNSNKVIVTNCVIGTGDDCIAIGDTNNDIDVSKITCGPGHGLSIGSLGKRTNEGDVIKVKFSNCTLTETTNGLRIKTYRGSPSLKASNLVFQDIVMNSVKNPIIIDQQYNSEHAAAPSKVAISDVHYINVQGTTISPIPVNLNCSTMFPCQGVELRDINLLPTIGARLIKGPLKSSCINAKFSIFGKFTAPGC